MMSDLAAQLRRGANTIYLCVNEDTAHDIAQLFIDAAEALDANNVRLPTTIPEAELMQKIGFNYIAENAPDRLTELGRDKAAALEAAKELYKAAACGLSTLKGFGVPRGARIQFIESMIEKHARFAPEEIT